MLKRADDRGQFFIGLVVGLSPARRYPATPVGPFPIDPASFSFLLVQFFGTNLRKLPDNPFVCLQQLCGVRFQRIRQLSNNFIKDLLANRDCIVGIVPQFSFGIVVLPCLVVSVLKGNCGSSTYEWNRDDDASHPAFCFFFRSSGSYGSFLFDLSVCLSGCNCTCHSRSPLSACFSLLFGFGAGHCRSFSYFGLTFRSCYSGCNGGCTPNWLKNEIYYA